MSTAEDLTGIKGEIHTLAEWAEKCNIDYHTLYARITRLNWTPEKSTKSNLNKQHNGQQMLCYYQSSPIRRLRLKLLKVLRMS